MQKAVGRCNLSIYRRGGPQGPSVRIALRFFRQNWQSPRALGVIRSGRRRWMEIDSDKARRSRSRQNFSELHCLNHHSTAQSAVRASSQVKPLECYPTYVPVLMGYGLSPSSMVSPDRDTLAGVQMPQLGKLSSSVDHDARTIHFVHLPTCGSSFIWIPLLAKSDMISSMRTLVQRSMKAYLGPASPLSNRRQSAWPKKVTRGEYAARSRTGLLAAHLRHHYAFN